MGVFGDKYHVRARFYESLATSIDAGLPLDRALALVAENENRLGTAAAQMESRVAGGQALSHAMEAHPTLFSRFEADSVEAGERSGRLPEVLRRLARSFAARGEAVGRIVQGLVYPLVLLHGAILLPPLFLLFRDGAAAYLAAVLPLVLGVYGAAAACWWLYRTLASKAAGREKIDRLLLALPFVREIVRSLALADYTHVFTTLYSAGIPILEALEKAAKASRNRVFERAGSRVAEAVRRGAQLNEGFFEAGVFPRLFVETIRVGEAAGRLEPSLEQAERLARRQAEEELRRFAARLPLAAYALAAILVAYVVLRFWARMAGSF